MIDLNKFNRITSNQNPLIKNIKGLQSVGVKSAKLRQENSVALIEGVHLIESWCTTEVIHHLKSIIISDQSLISPEITRLIVQIQYVSSRLNHQIDFYILNDSLIKDVTEFTEASLFIGLINIPQLKSFEDSKENFVVLDGIQDAGNVGTILRTAAAAGYKNIICTKGTAQVWSPKVLRAAMGAHTFLNIWDGVSPTYCIEHINVPMLATSLDAHLTIYQAEKILLKNHAWIFGNEGFGVSQLLLEHSTRLFIPQELTVESLNVGAAAAICLFEARRLKVSQNP